MEAGPLDERASARGPWWLHLCAWILGVCIGLAACGAAGAGTGDVKPVGPSDQPPEEAQDLLDQLEQARAEQERIQAELQAMSVPELVDRLNEESQSGLEPFNSLAFREIRRRGEEIADELAEVILAESRPTFLGVLALRRVNPRAYETMDSSVVIGILIDNLRTAEYFNGWGLPHLYWEDAGQAMIEQGKAAVPSLTNLLEDGRPAPVYGEEEAMESDLYGYRVKDYAFALIREIEGQRRPVPTEPAERDSLIEDFLNRE